MDPRAPIAGRMPPHLLVLVCSSSTMAESLNLVLSTKQTSPVASDLRTSSLSMPSTKQGPLQPHVSRRHIGTNVFPNDLFFGQLIRHALQDDLIAIRDPVNGYLATYRQLLTDVLCLRKTFEKEMESEIVNKLEGGQPVFVGLIGTGGYEFVVGFLALMALGAIIVPMASGVTLKEALYFTQRAQISSILTTQVAKNIGEEIQESLRLSTAGQFKAMSITPSVMKEALATDQMIVSCEDYVDPNKPGYVIFTSGTNGPPKGTLMRRGAIFDVALTFWTLYNIRPKDCLLHTLPVHHATGIHVSLLPFLVSGACVEFRSGNFSSEWVWERFRQGGIDYFSGVPTMYARLMQFHEQVNLKKPEATQRDYTRCVQDIKELICGSAALPGNLQQKWSELRGGRPILTRYGGSEFGAIFWIPPSSRGVPPTSAGIQFPGTEVRLEEATGELLVKSPLVYKEYVNDATATLNSFDRHGFFKTGDAARQDGEYYFISGRMSVDILKSGGYKMSAIDVEQEILKLEFVSEAVVVGVDDEEYGQRVAAVVVLKTDIRPALSLVDLRTCLQKSLSKYKLPTLLRVVDAIPKNLTGKVNKKQLAQTMFPGGWHAAIQENASKGVRARM